MIGNYFPVGIVLSSRSYMCCFVCCPGRFEDFVVVIFYDTGHLLVAVVAHLHIVFVENLMKFILFPEVFLYKVEELLSNISLNASLLHDMSFRRRLRAAGNCRMIDGGWFDLTLII